MDAPSTIGGPVPTTEEYDEAAERVEALQAEKAEKEDRLEELEQFREELVEQSGDLVDGDGDEERLEELRAEIRDVDIEREQAESAVEKLTEKIDKAERRRESAAAKCYRLEAERLREEGVEALGELVELAREGVQVYRKWYGKPGTLGTKKRYKSCTQRADRSPGHDPVNQLQEEGVREEVSAVLSAFGNLTNAVETADRNRAAEAENEPAA